MNQHWPSDIRRLRWSLGLSLLLGACMSTTVSYEVELHLTVPCSPFGFSEGTQVEVKLYRDSAGLGCGYPGCVYEPVLLTCDKEEPILIRSSHMPFDLGMEITSNSSQRGFQVLRFGMPDWVYSTLPPESELVPSDLYCSGMTECMAEGDAENYCPENYSPRPTVEPTSTPSFETQTPATESSASKASAEEGRDDFLKMLEAWDSTAHEED